jgi:hypothetical protein
MSIILDRGDWLPSQLEPKVHHTPPKVKVESGAELHQLAAIVTRNFFRPDPLEMTRA